MAKTSDLSPGFADDTDSWLDSIIADEHEPERVTLWRLGSWGVAAVVALIAGLLAAEMPETTRRADLAAAELAAQGQQLQALARDARQDSRRLTAAVDILNKDRDRLFGRVSSLEQGLESVTGSIQRAAPSTAAAPASPAADKAAGSVASPVQPSPVPAPVDTSPASPVPQGKVSIPPQAAQIAAVQASQPPPVPAKAAVEPAPIAVASTGSGAAAPAPPAPQQLAAIPPAVAPIPADATADAAPVAQTQFGLDLGGASSLEGLRALWSGLNKTHGKQLASLNPVLAIRQSSKGVGLQVHLVAGPIPDAAAAARLCAALTADDRACETTIFEGQKLTAGPEETLKRTAPTARPQARRRQASRQPVSAPPAPPPAPEKPTISSLLGLR